MFPAAHKKWLKTGLWWNFSDPEQVRGGGTGTFHISSSFSPNTSLGYVKLAWFDAFFVAGGGVWGELREEVLHPVREDRAERHRQHLPHPPRQGLRHRRRGGGTGLLPLRRNWTTFSDLQHRTQYPVPSTGLLPLTQNWTTLCFQICSTQYESECLTEQEIHEVCMSNIK